MAATWIVQQTADPRFPFRITIEQDGRTLLAVRAQNRWPGAGSQIFCLRETEFAGDEPLEEVERAPVAHLARLGRKLSVTLDRAQRKRCEFLKVEKPRKGGPGTVEQIFFRTETGVRAHRTSNRVELVPQAALDVAVDVREQFPWSFPGARVTRRRLPSGDYALVEQERLAAVVERKSLPDLLGVVHEIRGFHQQLSELESYAHAALVVEAQYADLGNPARIGRWPASHLLRVAAEISALHPTVPLVFAGNRKLANVWTQRFFAAVASALRQPLPDLVREPVLRFEADPADGGMDTAIRVAALSTLPDGFAFAHVRREVPAAPDPRIRRVLCALRSEGRLACEGHGRAARWRRTPAPGPAV